MKRMHARIGLLAAVVGLALVATATPALAADDLPGLKSALTARIDLRLAALAKDTAAITAARYLTAADRSTLTTLVNADTAAMNTLRTKVAGETTAAALKDDATSMVNDYRVFLLVGPKVRLVIAGDAEQVGIATARQAYDRMVELVAKAKAGGTDTSAPEVDLATMKSALDSAAGHLNGQVAAVLAIPPGPDGATIRAGVATVRAAIGTTRADLRTATAAGKRVAAFLKSH